MSTARQGSPDPAQGTAASEKILKLDGQVYDGLAEMARSGRARCAVADLLGAERERFEAFLFLEARLLDSGQYREWIKLLDDDFICWIPASPDAVDARQTGSINFDDRRRIIDRVTLIETNVQWAQVPRSRTCRMLSNVEAFTVSRDVVHVRSNLAVWEYRARHAQCYVGSQEHELVTVDGQTRIRKKIVRLLDCDQPQGNTTFII